MDTQLSVLIDGKASKLWASVGRDRYAYVCVGNGVGALTCVLGMGWEHSYVCVGDGVGVFRCVYIRIYTHI